MLPLLLFYLLLPPAPTPVCSLWLSQPATAADLAAACPEGLNLEQYRVDFVNLWDGSVDCTQPAAAIYAPSDFCGFTQSLDNFRMEIYLPAGQNGEVLCSVTTYNDTPTRDEIAAACPWSALNAYDEGRTELRYIRAIEPEPDHAPTIPAPQPGPGLYDQPTSTAELTTRQPLAWLAGRLIWHGRIRPVCGDGLSGLDPFTLAANPCGESAAAAEVTRWQNQYDDAIYAAALAEGVPARLLKRVILLESQGWPLWDQRPAGEIGLVQVTRAGADQYLRWYAPGYGYASGQRQTELQSAWLNSLRCQHCTLAEAIDQERANLPAYARLLKAYRYASPDWYQALVLWNGVEYAERIING